MSTGSSTLLGTWETMAPEQWIRSKDAGPKVDVYALGVLLFRMLAGRLPLVAEEQKDLMYLHLFEPPPLGMLDEVARPEVRALVARMLEKKPSLRPTMREIEEVIAGLQGDR
ncbi:MAG: protein kinase [Minicystis sp.]